MYATSWRRQTRVLSPSGNNPLSLGQWVQVSRLGMPLVNEVVIPLGKKDRFNASEPADLTPSSASSSSTLRWPG